MFYEGGEPMNSNNTEQKNKFKTGDGSAAAGPEVTGGSARGRWITGRISMGMVVSIT